jgi:ABC-type antimicrobial peptide transport system permease subunit
MDDLFSHFAIAGICAAVLLTLAALGVYGVVGFMVATRRREIGVRIALGASRTRVLGAVTADAMRLVAPGAAVGLLGGIYWIRVADPAWYALGSVEPVVYAAAIGIVVGVAALAGLPSARRAAAVDPLQAIRAE